MMRLHPRPRIGLAALLGAACLVLAAPGFPDESPPGSAPDSTPDADAAAAATTPVTTPVVVPSYRRAENVAVLTIREGIDHVTLRSLERRVQLALDEGANAIVLDIDTPGGRVDATLDICHLIKTDCPANTVAWINPNAYSAGSIIALACREIVVAPQSRLGDAAPIAGVPGVGLMPLPAAERAKQESPLLEEVIDSARRSHYDENLAQSFISVGIELWMLENNTTGERIFVDRVEYNEIFGEDPPSQITSITPPAAATGVLKPHPLINKIIPEADQDATPIDPETLKMMREKSQSLPPVRDRLTAADRDDWTLRLQVISNDRLLTVNQDEAVFYGLAERVVRNDAELKAFFGAKTITRYDRTWSESLVRFLTSFYVRAVLIVIFLIALFVELAVPGTGVFGLTAVAALLVLIGAPWLAGAAQWWQLALILAGMLLVALEIFVIPGTGVAGVSGVICVFAGLVGTFLAAGDISSSEGRTDLWHGLATTAIAVFAAFVGMYLVSRNIKSFPLLNKFVLQAEVGKDARPGDVTTGLLAAMASPQRTLEVGDVGVAMTDMRPAGRADFDGRMVDVQSVGPFIDRGRPVRVVSVGRFSIEVEEAEA